MVKAKYHKDDNASTQRTSEANETSFAQGNSDKSCYCCGKKGHLSPDCPQKNSIKKEDWAIQKSQTVYVQNEKQDDHQDDDSVGDNVSTISRGSSKIGWSALLIKQKESLYTEDREIVSRMKNCITLDTGSTLSIFSNPALVEGIRTSETTLALNTNAGVSHSNQEAIVPSFGKVYYDANAIANIFGFSDLKKKHRITYDSDKEDAFSVYMNDGVVKFECSPDGLYQFKVSKHYQDTLIKDQEQEGTSNLISTVAENRAGYTQRQYERAKEARRLYHIVLSLINI